MFENLDSEQRLNLVRFVISFAWADFNVSQEEKAYVVRLVKRLELSADERLRVEDWLKRPPSAESLDPNFIPFEHREVFLDTIRGLVATDLDVTAEERDALQLLEKLLAGE